MVRVDDLVELCDRSEAVSIHIPLVEETRHAISTAELATFGERGVLLNTSRGGIVDKPALVEALEGGDIGDRGVGIGRTSQWAGYVDSHVGGEDAEVLVGTMIENERAVENLEEILAVPELGFAFVDPADLAMSMSEGEPLEKNEEAVEAAIDRTLEACLAADVPIGRIRNDVTAAREAADAGYQIVRIGGDIGAIGTALRNKLDELD